MNLESMRVILEKIKEYDTILLFRHFRPDGDAVGSTRGLQEILKLTFPEKKVYLQNADFSKYLEFLGPEDELLPDEAYADALGIVLDTATPDRVSNKKFSLCREVIKFDHHIPVVTYGNYQWVEELASSTCEMVAKFYFTFREELKINTEAATYLYLGMVTDSGRFRFRDVSGDTLRYAGMLLDQGVNTDVLFAHLYMKDLTEMRLQSYVYKKLKITENGVAYIYVDKKMQKKFGLSNEQASAVISHLESIRGSLIWVALIDNPDGTIRVRLRSRFVTVSEIGQKYRGGGHACAAGATLHSKKEIGMLLADLDAHLAAYKANNEGWL